MSFSTASHRGLESPATGNYCAVNQSFAIWRFHHRRRLPPALADRSLFQNAQAEPENQNLCRHFRKRLADSDLDCSHRHASTSMASFPIHKELVVFQSRIPVADESIHLSGPQGLA